MPSPQTWAKKSASTRKSMVRFCSNRRHRQIAVGGIFFWSSVHGLSSARGCPIDDSYGARERCKGSKERPHNGATYPGAGPHAVKRKRWLECTRLVSRYELEAGRNASREHPRAEERSAMGPSASDAAMLKGRGVQQSEFSVLYRSQNHQAQ